MKKQLLILIFLASGCTTVEVLKFQDHPRKPVTTLQVFKSRNFIFSSTEHQFWLCREDGNQLNCKRECGGGAEIACPKARVPYLQTHTTKVDGS